MGVRDGFLLPAHDPSVAFARDSSPYAGEPFTLPSTLHNMKNQPAADAAGWLETVKNYETAPGTE